MDTTTQEKWDRASRSFDLMASRGPEWRWKPAKWELFNLMKPDAKILFLALGTGLDIPSFPPKRDITAIDISPKMIEDSLSDLVVPRSYIEHIGPAINSGRAILLYGPPRQRQVLSGQADRAGFQEHDLRAALCRYRRPYHEGL